jgi:hypothetical protein
MDQLPYELDQPTLRNWTLLVLELSAQIIPIKVFFFFFNGIPIKVL